MHIESEVAGSPWGFPSAGGHQPQGTRSAGDMRLNLWRGPPLPARVVGERVRAGLDAMRQGTAYGAKVVLEPQCEELMPFGALTPQVYPQGERANWKLNALISVNTLYGAVKIVGSHALNRGRGLARSHSIVILYDKLTMCPLAALDGTTLSAQRTGAYASVVIDLFLRHEDKFSVFLFGAGPVAHAVLHDLVSHHADRIEHLYVKSRTPESAEAFVKAARAYAAFPLAAVRNLAALSDCHLTITASNASAPLFEACQVRKASVVLHLGGDETPEALIRNVLAYGTVVCDDIATVAHRCSQSLPLFFQRRGQFLDVMADTYGIRNLWQVLNEDASYRYPMLVTCVGLPVLDLYLAQHAYETAYRNCQPLT